VDSQDTVVNRLSAVILAAAKEHRQLPTERELCQSLGISRTALREHLQALEVVGLLRRDQGRGTSVGADINCAVIGYTAQPPTANLAPPAPGSQFPPR